MSQTVIKSIKDFTEKEAIHCATKEEAEKLCEIMHNSGMKWADGKEYKLDTRWSMWEVDSAYIVHVCVTAPVSLCSINGYTIYTLSNVKEYVDTLPKEEPIDLPEYGEEILVWNEDENNSNKYTFVCHAPKHKYPIIVRPIDENYSDSIEGFINFKRIPKKITITEAEIREKFGIAENVEIDIEK